MPAKKTSKSKKSSNKLSNLFASTQSKVLLVLGAAMLGGILFFQASASQPTYFNPTTATSRQALAAFLFRAEDMPQNRTAIPCAKGGNGPFKDVPITHVFCNEIAAVTDRKILTEYPDGTFRPVTSVTRQAAAAALYRADGSPAFSATIVARCKKPATINYRGVALNRRPTFTDVTYKNQFCKEIEYVASKGYLLGYANKTFKPTTIIPRQIMAVALYNRAGKPAPQNRSADSGFLDITKDHKYYNAIKWLGDEGISLGYPNKL